MTAWLDEFRIVKGSAAWTSGFTPPAVAYATGDIPAFTGLVTDRTAVLVTTEAADTAAFNGTVAAAAATGTLIVTEAADTAAFNGQVLSGVGGTLTTTEAADTAVFNGAVTGTLVNLTTTEAADTAAFNGTVAFPALTGTLTTTEAADTAAFNGLVFGVVTGTLVTTEAADTAAFNGLVFATGTITGTLNATEASDNAALFGTVPVTRPRGAGFVDTGYERRRNPRGLRQAQKFFKEQQEARDAEKRRLEEVAQRAREKAEQDAAQAMQAGEMARAQAILATARDQQQRQGHLDNMMMALANARVDEARQRLMQVQHAQAMQQDEEDAISVLLLH